METTFISRDNNDVKFTMAFDAETFENAQIEVYKKTKDKYVVDGFRKGKAPRKIIEQHYGESVFMESAIDELMQGEYPAALGELAIEPIEMPRVEFSEVKKGEGFTATVTVAVPPEIEVKDYTGVQIKDVRHEVTDEDVDKELEAMQTKGSRFVSSEDAAADGDIVNIDYEGYTGEVQFEGGTAQGQNLKLGSGTFIPGFEEQLIGAAKDDKVEVKVTFPEEYHSEDLKGKEAVFKVTVNEVRKEERPELNDDFAKDASEFDTLAELKADIREKLTKAAEERAGYEKKNAVLEAVYETNQFDVPRSMIEDAMDDMMNEFAQGLKQQGIDAQQYFQYIGQDPAAFREQTRGEAEKRVKMRLIIKSVAKAEGFDASEAEVDEELTQMAAQYGLEKEKLVDYLGKSQLSLIKEDIKNRKAVDYMFETAIIGV
ncbi:MAG: trigger factor [Clostridiales Family XIII bacterium]|jgi:trigger factor|nr:trigger factor [Clostridiales Family XIII bacterium]